MNDAEIGLSLVIPAYNEEQAIEECVREADGVLARLGRRYEIIVVDDGSTDTTFERLRSLKTSVPSLRAVRFSLHRGQTTAMAAGFERARGAIVVTMDGDMQNDPADIPHLLDMMGEWDVVCGVREHRRDGFVRRASSAVANVVRNRLTAEDIRDVGCTLRAYRASYLRRLKLFEGMHRFLPTLLKLEGARVVEVSVRHRARTKGTNKYGIANRLFIGLRDLFAVRWMKSRYIRYEIKEEIK
ncbi:MAG TPA: glycosyltransferase family 2 protein [Candidatus Bathyarchaeia archaeon]|nr:glycosyltransferase family 2 protein [Candidatus Bathyarchaeia archaeon]